VHRKDLKFGIYSDAGTKTCGSRRGSHGFEFQDSKRYAAWGVDDLKYDWCYTGTQDAEASYRVMSEALRSTGRPISSTVETLRVRSPLRGSNRIIRPS
jgi:alpha-galactosidase